MSTKKHTIYVINNSENGKSYWNRAGVAFGNRDGSFRFKLDILPQTKFQLRGEAFRQARSRRGVTAASDNQGALPWLSARVEELLDPSRQIFALIRSAGWIWPSG